MWSGNGPIKTIDSPGYAEALRMAQAEDETLGIRNIYGTRSSKNLFIWLSTVAMVIRFAVWLSVWKLRSQKKNYRLLIMRSSYTIFVSTITWHDIQQLSINLPEFTQIFQLMNWQNNSG